MEINKEFSKRDYMMEFRNIIKEKAFKFEGGTFFCTDAKVQNEKFIIYTERRTFVLIFSQLEKITILNAVPDSKKIVNLDLIEAIKLDSQEIEYPTNRTLSFEKVKYYYDKYHDYNLDNSGTFTIEEDELIKMITPSEASEILGRTPLSISARKSYVKRTKGNQPELNVYSSPTKIETTNSTLGDNEALKIIVDKLVEPNIKIDDNNHSNVIKTEPKIQNMENTTIQPDQKALDIKLTPRQELFILMNSDQVCVEMFGQYNVDDISFYRMSLVSKIQEGNPGIFN